MGRRVGLDRGLALEAAFTAKAWRDNPTEVRGGPWCLGRLTQDDKNELQEVYDAVEGESLLIDQERAVREAAARLPRRGSLNRHLHQECFRCGRPLVKCSCRGLGRKDDVLHVAPTKRRSGGPGKSGHEWREAKGLQSGDAGYKRHKWGIDAKAAIKRANAKNNFRSSGPSGRRPVGSRKRPAASD